MYDTEDIDMVGVAGAGTMGSGIAQVAAMVGYDAVMRDLESEYVGRDLPAIDDSLLRFVLKEKLTGDETDAAKARVTGTTEFADPGDCDLVVEAAVENMDVRRDIFADLGDIVPEGAVLATNTSMLLIMTITAATERPEFVVGLYLMNPVPITRGVEVVRGEKTDNDAAAFAHDFSEAFGKGMWEFNDRPGFVTNRILMPWLSEGIRAYDEGVALKEDTDRGMTLGTNVPTGPLTFVDHINLDICLGASETLFEELGDHYKPAYLLKRKVATGDLGKKTGKGFYEYD